MVVGVCELSKNWSNTTSRKPIREITSPQRKTLQEIQQFIEQRGFPPTLKELAEILGISSASAYDQVNQLVRKGFLRREQRKARGIVIIRKPKDLNPVLKINSNEIQQMEEKTNGDL